MRGGEPRDLPRDLALVADLPGRARDALWSVLGPSLRRDVPDSIGARLEAFCREHDCAPDDVARAVGAFRAVLRDAHARGLPLDVLARQLEAALGGAPWLRGFLAPGFDAAMAQLSAEAGHLASLEHGRVLVGADFRVDTIELSQHGPSDTKVALLTLRTREGSREERFTVTAHKEALLALRESLDRALARFP